MGTSSGIASLVSEQIVGFPLIFCVLIGTSWKPGVILLLTSLVIFTLIINIHIYGCVRFHRFPTSITMTGGGGLIGNGNSVCGVGDTVCTVCQQFYSAAAL